MLTEHSGGPINDQMTHLVDLCRFLVGEVVDVVAIGGNNTPAGEHPKAAVAINFVNGACGTLFYSFLAHEKEIAFSAFTEEGAMHLRDWDFKAPGDVEEGDRNQIFVRETAAFLGIEGQIMCDFDDAMRTQGVIDTIKQALDTGRRLSIQNSGGAYVD
jgi:predicted dehydrogenase